jgi:type I site-specific restriction-modification system R (restriction) subunit
VTRTPGRKTPGGAAQERSSREEAVLVDRLRDTLAWLIDFDGPESNDWLTLKQFTVVQASKKRRPDVVVFLNDLPLGLIELRSPGDALPNATFLGFTGTPVERIISDIVSGFRETIARLQAHSG